MGTPQKQKYGFALGLALFCTGCNPCEVPKPLSWIWPHVKDLPDISKIPWPLRSLLPDWLKEPADVPAIFTYTRPDAPQVHISINSRSDSQGGLTSDQIDLLKNTLDRLPPSHLMALKKIVIWSGDMVDGDSGYATPDNSIVLNNKHLKDPAQFSQALIHEIGHEVEFFQFTDPQVQEWRNLHAASTDPADFVSAYAMTNQCEDCAETYLAWGTDTTKFAFNAVEAARNGHTVLLQKFLFMAGVFANPDGTLNTYADYYKAYPGDVPAEHVQEKEILAYYRTADSLTVGNYTYRLLGNTITDIEDLYGNVIVDNLSIKIPSTFLHKTHITGPPPIQEVELMSVICDENGDCTPGGGPSTNGLSDAKMKIPNVQIVSPKSPTDYIPLLSPEGYTALAGEQAIANPQHQLTIQDQVRPHGNFGVIAPPTSPNPVPVP